jgi:hypothetical protein
MAAIAGPWLGAGQVAGVGDAGALAPEGVWAY